MNTPNPPLPVFCASVDRSGQVHISDRVVPGAMAVGRGTRAELDEALGTCCRLAYDNVTWIVPGVRDAGVDDTLAMAEFEKWETVFRPRLRAIVGKEAR